MQFTALCIHGPVNRLPARYWNLQFATCNLQFAVCSFQSACATCTAGTTFNGTENSSGNSIATSMS